MDTPSPVTYGEFPELFAGFPPDQIVDLDDIKTWLAVSALGDQEAVRRLYPPGWYEAREAVKTPSKVESWQLIQRLGLGG